ncbi:hypothetical protein [Deinococcus aquiradiocola]|uniref:Uncharacterized protein n=1 Tax=Deinococcus aquiradiocola TaxID=393059 RepID=A0A917PCP3_9DEIO|nr:hypothetical protein [Deinococcus aquiradiocola]GGJ70756.1 hypothetical protein GCM10008939_13970 [Deinococcus aquiradiocola]
MTDTERNLDLNAYLQRAEQAVTDFEFDEGLHVAARTAPGGGDLLELVAESSKGSFTYQARLRDLAAHGDSWFLRRGLRSLNDLYRAGHLPQGQDADHQLLEPQENYER